MSFEPNENMDANNSNERPNIMIQINNNSSGKEAGGGDELERLIRELIRQLLEDTKQATRGRVNGDDFSDRMNNSAVAGALNEMRESVINMDTGMDADADADADTGSALGMGMG